MSNVKKILLADDDPNDVELILHALAKHHLQDDVQVVVDGEDTLNYLLRLPPYKDLEPGNPELVILDMKMPKIDGLQVLQKIRAETALKEIPVVMLTSSQLESDIVKAYSYGANAYVTKPVEYRAFIETVASLGFFWGISNHPPPSCR